MSGTYDWQPSFAGGVLGPGLHGRVDLAKYSVGLRTGKNIFIHAHGGFSNRAGTRFVAEARNSAVPQRLIPFERDEITTYALAINNSHMRVVQDGSMVQTGAGVTYELALPYNAPHTAGLNYVQSIDVMYLAQIEHKPRKLSHFAANNWTLTDLLTMPNVPQPGLPTIAASAMGDGKTYAYRVSAVKDGVEGLPGPANNISNAGSLDKEGAHNTISWAAVTPQPDEYRIYRLRGGVWGYIGFTAGNVTMIIDDNISPDTNKSIRQAATVFNAPGKYPSVVTIAQQRLIWAASKDRPETVWGSVIGEYENYTRSAILRADDRIEMDISGEKLNRVTGLVGMQELIALTGSGEYSIGATDGTISATQPKQTKYGGSGSSGVRPVIVGESILYVDRSSQLVRDLRYQFENNGYAGNDLSVLANHYFTGRKVVEWAYCHAPYGVVWAAMDDGKVLSLTYKREQEVWAWTEHDFGGKVESLCAIHENGIDALYLSVIRQINGQTKRYIERMADRPIGTSAMDSCFLDCAITYNGPSTKTIGGLAHLEGQTVSALADSDVVEGLVVTGGQVTLPFSVTRAHVGLPYQSVGETLPLYVNLQGTGSSRGLPVKATEAFIQVEKTRGVVMKTSAVDRLSDIKQAAYDMDDEIALYTGLWRVDFYAGFSDLGTVSVIQNNPLPMTILGISPKWTVGR